MKKILALTLVVLSLFVLVSCGDDGDVPSGMKLASNTEIVDYKLFVPENWLISLNDTRTAAQVSESDRTNINVAQWNYTGSIDDWWTNEYKPQVFEMGGYSDIAVETLGAELLLDQKPAKKYVYTAKLGDSYFKFEVIACVTQGSIYVMHVTYMQDTAEEGMEITYSKQETNKEAINSIIENFRFD